jgi:hypothetical protein
MKPLPYFLAWVRVLLLIRSITATTWGHEVWPEVKPVLRRALEMRRQIAREGWWNLDPRGRRLRATHAALLMKETELAKALGLEGRWS